MVDRICREFLSGLCQNGCLEAGDKFFEVVYVKLIVKFHAFFGFHFVDDGLEWVDVFLASRFQAEHHVAIHLYETAIGIICKTRVIRLLGQTLNDVVIESEVKDSVHHARH